MVLDGGEGSQLSHPKQPRPVSRLDDEYEEGGARRVLAPRQDAPTTRDGRRGVTGRT